MKMPGITSVVVFLAVSCLIRVSAATAQIPAGKTIDADAEKVFVLSDFESDAEMFNAGTDKGKPSLEAMIPVWLANKKHPLAGKPARNLRRARLPRQARAEGSRQCGRRACVDPDREKVVQGGLERVRRDSLLCPLARR